MDAALNPKARPTARERCASAFSSEALRIFLVVPTAAPIPSAGAVLLVVILETCQVPAGFGFALILAVDWLYDRPETMVNVAGDSFAAVLAQLKHGDDLPPPAEAAEDPPPKAREST